MGFFCRRAKTACSRWRVTENAIWGTSFGDGVIWGHPQASLGDTHHFDPASVGRVVPTSIRGHPLGEEIGEEIGNRGHPPNDLNSGTLTRLSLTRLSQCALTALKGRHVIAQGNALGSLPQ